METKLNYKIEGSGTAIVLLHGFCESLNIWKDFVPVLSKNFKVLSIDLPGFGESPFEVSNSSIEQYATLVHECIQNENIEKYCLVGHSLGGYVALAIAEMYPSDLLGLVMFHSSAFADTDEKKLSRNKSIEFVEKNGTAAFVKTLIPGLFFEANKEIFHEEISYLINEASQISPLAIKGALLAMRDRKDRIGILKNLPVPSLFIIGNEDAAIPLDTSLKQCYLPPSFDALFLGETGHMGMIEKPARTLEKIKEFAGNAGFSS